MNRLYTYDIKTRVLCAKIKEVSYEKAAKL